MSWLMYATRSSSRTILPSSVAGCAARPEWWRIPSLSVALEPVDDPQRVLVMAKRASEALGQTAIEDVLAEVAEGRMPEIVAEADRLDEVLVETERAGDGPRDSRDLEGMREPGAVVIALGSDEYLRLVLQTPKRLAVPGWCAGSVTWLPT